MQIIRFICDCCGVEEQDDDAVNWSERRGMDLCPECKTHLTKAKPTHSTDSGDQQ